MVTGSRLEHQTLKVRQLIDDYRAGRMVIPEFQREYVWQPVKAAKLIDSLYRGFPVSSLLLWQSTQETRARRRNPRPMRSGPMNWLIDGQQRVITLSRTLNGDEGIDVVFHPEEEKFRSSNAATRKDPNWLRVSELWDDDLYRQIRRNLDGSRHADKREARFEAVRRILDNEIPVVRMVDHSFDDAVESLHPNQYSGRSFEQERHRKRSSSCASLWIRGRSSRAVLRTCLDRLNPILRGWTAYFGWLNSAQHFRKVDQYVTWKLRLWLQAKHQRRGRAFWKTPLAYWRQAGLYSTQGRIVHTS